jgi:hypothetical protein
MPSTFLDGTDNTILVVEAGNPVVWTKPDDVPYHPKKPIPTLGSPSSPVFHALMASGLVRSLPRRLDQRTLRAAITPAGGEVIDWKKVSGERARGAGIREDALNRLTKRNGELKEEASALREVLLELKEELHELRWAVQAEKLLEADPAASKLQRENQQMEKALREAREEARKLLLEIQKMKKEIQKRPRK